MDTNKRGGGPWSLYGLLILACFTNVCVGQKTAREIGVGNPGLSCHVCNSLVGKCEAKDDSTRMNCKDEYFKKVYGEAGENEGQDLKNFPLSLSELAGNSSENSNDSIGWNLSGFPSAFKKGSELAKQFADGTHRFSGFQNFIEDRGSLKGGFMSCKVMRISVVSQKNGDQQVQIGLNTPRVIRSCSVMKPENKVGRELFNDKGCRVFNYKTSAVEVCYCKDSNCNTSPYLHGSYWLIAASVLVLLAQI